MAQESGGQSLRDECNSCRRVRKIARVRRDTKCATSLCAAPCHEPREKTAIPTQVKYQSFPLHWKSMKTILQQKLYAGWGDILQLALIVYRLLTDRFSLTNQRFLNLQTIVDGVFSPLDIKIYLQKFTCKNLLTKIYLQKFILYKKI